MFVREKEIFKDKIIKQPQSLKYIEEEVSCGFGRLKREKGRSPQAVSKPERQKKKHFESAHEMGNKNIYT